MTFLKNLTLTGSALSILLLTACASSHVKPEDRDQTGAYDGVWIGTVDKPRSSTVNLPGNWIMNCEWEPYEIYLTIDDGRVQLGKLEGKSAISTEGNFRYDLTSGGGGMQGGILPGNSTSISIFSGNLAGDNPKGKYTQRNNQLGGEGCTANIDYRRLGA